MAQYKVACPKCLSVLRSAKALPEGAEVRCPRCQAPFRIPLEEAVAAAPVAASVGAGSAAAPPALAAAVTTTPYPQAALPAAMPAAMAQTVEMSAANTVSDAPSLALSGMDPRTKKVLWIAGGAVGALLLLLILVLVCFSGDGPGEVSPDAPTTLTSSKPAGPKPLIMLTPEEEKKVGQLVNNGVEWLKKMQAPDGSWAGDPVRYVAFVGLTLLECGVPASDPVVQKAAKYAREQAKTLNGTYGISLYLLFFDKLNDSQDRELLQTLAMRLVAGQTSQGGWSYHVPVLNNDEGRDLRQSLTDLGRRPANTLRTANPHAFEKVPGRARDAGIFHEPVAPPDKFYRGGGDNSNTQFALLALWTARRHKLPVDRSLELVVRRFRGTQNDNGSYFYDGHRLVVPAPSMTCAGLLGLAVDYGLAEEAKAGGPQQDPMIKKALTHLGQAVGKPNPKAKNNKTLAADMYFLWSVERVGVLYQLPHIDGKDWYRWGLEMLQDSQRPDGSWQSTVRAGHGWALTDTCFALLFLQRVNLAQDLTDKLNEIGLPAAAAAFIPGKE